MKDARYSAVREVASKSDPTVQRETARKWAARAAACYTRYRETCDARWLERTKGYRDEALEHAALVGDRGRFVGAVQKKLDRTERAAKKSLRTRRK